MSYRYLFRLVVITRTEVRSRRGRSKRGKTSYEGELMNRYKKRVSQDRNREDNHEDEEEGLVEM